MVLVQGAGVPGVWREGRGVFELNGGFRGSDAGCDDDLAEAVGDDVGDAVVVAMQDHGVHTQGKELEDEAAAVLEWDAIVD